MSIFLVGKFIKKKMMRKLLLLVMLFTSGLFAACGPMYTYKAPKRTYIRPEEYNLTYVREVKGFNQRVIYQRIKAYLIKTINVKNREVVDLDTPNQQLIVKDLNTKKRSMDLGESYKDYANFGVSFQIDIKNNKFRVKFFKVKPNLYGYYGPTVKMLPHIKAEQIDLVNNLEKAVLNNKKDDF